MQNNLLETKVVLSPSWRITFDLTPRGYVKNESSILHGTVDGDVGKMGDRIPGIWFLPNDTKIKFCHAISGNANSCYKTWIGLKINRTYNIMMQQIVNDFNGRYYFRIFIDRFNIFSVVNTSPEIFKNVKYYSGDPWSQPAKAIVDNFKLVTFDQGISCSVLFVDFFFLKLLAVVKEEIRKKSFSV